MKGDLKRLKIEDIESLLHGFDPEEGIRYIDSNNFSNEVKIFVRKQNDEDVTIKKDTFRPFMWFKGFDFDRDFLWEYFAVHHTDYNEETNSIFYENKSQELIKDQLEIVSKSQDENEYIVRRFLSDVKDRRRLCFNKMKQYNIEITEQITHINESDKYDRMENGFKYLVHINAPEKETNYDNPLFCYNKRGELKKINGSFNNLIDFFREGGLDIWKRSGVFLDSEKLKEFWKTSTNFQKLLFFFGFPAKPFLFSFIDANNEDNQYLDQDILKISSEIDYEELIHLTFTIFNENVRASKIFDFYEKKIRNNDLDFLVQHADKFAKHLKLKIDDTKLMMMIQDGFSFDSKKGFANLNALFIENGIDLFVGEDRLFYKISTIEQYMIQSGKRLFKGFEEYPELKSLTMDIETKGLPEFSHRKDAALHPTMGMIFKIGMYCNNGFEKVLNATNQEEELQIIEEFFKLTMELNPDLFLTYNGEGFDFPFIVKRYEILKNFQDEYQTYNGIRDLLKEYYVNPEEIYISKNQMFNRRAGNLKVGGSSESYTQTSILGINMCDTMFAVKRAAAINKAIPNFKLKDNIKFAKLAKPNRVYVEGNKIGDIENSKADFYLNVNNGDWFKYHKEIVFENDTYEQSKVKRKSLHTQVYGNEDTLYLWDEEYDKMFMESCVNTLKFTPDDIDGFFNNVYSKFKDYDKLCFRKNEFVGKWLEKEDIVTYQKVYNKLKDLRSNLNNVNLFYPEKDLNEYIITTGEDIIKRYLIDDLWETNKLDEFYSQATFLISKWLPTSYQRSATMGGASVWKLLLSAYSYQYGLAVPDYDEPREFTGGLVAMLSAGYHGKSFKADFSSLYPAEFYVHVDSPKIDLYGVYKLFMYYGWSTRIKYKKLMNEHKEKGEMSLSKKYEVRQLPIKILINSFYGMMGAAGVTPFADLVVAQGITCTGRQHLRHLIKWFTKKGYIATIAHTDGVFFSINTADLEYQYIGKGINWLVTKGKEYTGIAAHVAEYNDLYMKGIMGLDIDEIVESVINFSKGNYIYLKEAKDKKTGEVTNKVEIIGGAIIKKTQSEYITQFVEKEVVKLMQNKPLDFINAYWDYIRKIEEKRIDLKLIASKAKIKKTKAEYLQHIQGTNKNGAPLNRQVHMELLINNNLDIELGDTVYYVNTGKSKDDKDSLSPTTTFATCEIGEVDMSKINNVMKTRNKTLIKNFLLGLDSKSLLTVNQKVLDGDIFAILDDIEQWKNIKTKVRNLKKGIFVDFIKVEYVINCSIVDNYQDSQGINYNTDLYINKFNSAVHPLFVCFKPEIRDRLMINSYDHKPFLLESDLELINGVPFSEQAHNQSTYEEVMTITPEEMEYWDTVNIDPEDFVIERK